MGRKVDEGSAVEWRVVSWPIKAKTAKSKSRKWRDEWPRRLSSVLGRTAHTV